ncbi:MAG: hypothetical protein A3B08_04190 [Candidatus Taylorbacteria bacterium RIFCSPLOWO2_01_FULL_43_44]|nr:MAG: hypothetical protein A3B08_04190 [Candidatus Taylorbacteria bacterium RIFCSPLOWO2_01_FULL_43_44]
MANILRLVAAAISALGMIQGIWPGVNFTVHVLFTIRSGLRNLVIHHSFAVEEGKKELEFWLKTIVRVGLIGSKKINYPAANCPLGLPRRGIPE